MSIFLDHLLNSGNFNVDFGILPTLFIKLCGDNFFKFYITTILMSIFLAFQKL